MADPVSRLRFQGDEKNLGRALDRVESKMSGTARSIAKDAAKAETALKGIQTAADKIQDVKVDVKADTGKAETAIAGVGDNAGPVNVDVRADTGKAEAKIKGIEGKPVEIPVKADTAAAEAKIKGMGKTAGESAGSDAGGAFSGKFMGALAGVGFVSSLSGIVSDAFAAAAGKAKVTAGLQNQMGITPAEAKMYGDRVGTAYAGGLGDSKDQIASVYSSLSSDAKGWSKMTMAAQDDIAQGMTKVVQGLGVDLPTAAKGASNALNSGLVPDFKAAEDLIVTGYQTLGSKGQDWADTLGEYSGFFHNLGFDGAAALGVIQQGLQANARDTDYMADAFKEFNIRIIDGSATTKQALKDMGKEFAGIPEEIAKGGPAAFAATAKIIDKIKSIKDPIEQNRIGVALFGTQWEDTMKQVVSSIDLNMAKANTSYQGAVDKLAVATDTNMERVSRRWESGLSVVGEKLSTWANTGAEAVDMLADKFMNFGGGQVDGISKFIAGAAKAVGDLRAATEKKAIQVKIEAEWQKVQDIHNRLMKLPPRTPVVVDALTANATGDLERLGYKVRTLPNGQVEVMANTRPAEAQAQATLRWLNSLYANITVGVVGSGAGYALKNTKGGMAALATGGIVEGPGGVDNVPTWLTRGEHVTAEKYAKQPDNRRILENINSGRPWNAGMVAPSGSSSSPGGMGAGGSGGGRAPGVHWSGNTDTALATVVMSLVRSGKITIS